MPAVPAYTVKSRWDGDGRCSIEMHGQAIEVRHLHLPARSKPWFAARIDGAQACEPAASFTALLRRLDRQLGRGGARAPSRTALAGRIGKLERAMGALLAQLGTAPCRFGDVGGCLTHFDENPCSVGTARRLVCQPGQPAAEGA